MAPLPDSYGLLELPPQAEIETTKKRVKVKLAFYSDVSGARFECKLDKRKQMPCWDVRPLLEFKDGIDTVRAKLAEAQAAMGGGSA